MDDETTNSRGDTLNEIVDFVFPPTLQHPLAAARLVCYGMYGPLVNGELRSGHKKSHVISTWELNTMCLQIEREDILQIYLHKGQKFETLTKLEQDAVENQADVHLKKAKGKASLPQISKDDVRELLSAVNSNENGILSFHEVQEEIINFRSEKRILKYKLVYPNLATTARGVDRMGEGNGVKGGSAYSPYTSMKGTRVSAAVAYPSMFERNQGLSDPDRTAETNDLLSKHAFKICNLETSSDPSLVSNVRLLRGVGPSFPDPYISRRRGRVKDPWDDTSNMTAVQLGSLVLAAPSASTWKRKTTLG